MNSTPESQPWTRRPSQDAHQLLQHGPAHVRLGSGQEPNTEKKHWGVRIEVSIPVPMKLTAKEAKAAYQSSCFPSSQGS